MFEGEQKKLQKEIHILEKENSELKVYIENLTGPTEPQKRYSTEGEAKYQRNDTYVNL